MEYSAQKNMKDVKVDESLNSNLEMNAVDPALVRKQRTRKYMCAGLLTVITVVTVLVLVTQSYLEKQNELDAEEAQAKGEPVFDNGNPIVQVLLRAPDLDSIGTAPAPDGQPTLMYQFWNNPIFGGPIYEYVEMFLVEKDEYGNDKYDSDGQPEQVPHSEKQLYNKVLEHMQEDWDNKGEEGTYGLFYLKNLCIDETSSRCKEGASFAYYRDYTFFTTGLDSDSYTKLFDANNTEVQDGETRKLSEFASHINGYGIMIEYEYDFTGSLGWDQINFPNDVESIYPYALMETKFEGGKVSSTPVYTNQCNTYEGCSIGFMVGISGRRGYSLEGKGVTFNFDDVSKPFQTQGLWYHTSNDIVEDQVLEDFLENQLPTIYPDE